MRIEDISESFLQAVGQVAEYKPTISEEVHVPGYGVLSLHHAKREAQLATEVAHEHTERGNHMHAAVQHERAAMFHRAIHAHLQNQQSAPHPGPSSQREDTMSMESIGIPITSHQKYDSWKNGSQTAGASHFTKDDEKKTESAWTSNGPKAKLVGTYYHEHPRGPNGWHITNAIVESKEPDVNRVETKYRRQQALKNKQRDKDKQTRRENKE